MELKKTTLEKVEELIERYPALAVCREDLRAAVQAGISCSSAATAAARRTASTSWASS